MMKRKDGNKARRITTSIRTFLLVNLLISVALVAILAIISNLWLEHKHFTAELDDELTQVGYTLQAIFSNVNTNFDFDKIQNRISKISVHPSIINDERSLFGLRKRKREKIQFQVYNPEGKLLLYSPHAPAIPFNDLTVGFHNLILNHHLWRVSVFKDEQDEITTIVSIQAGFHHLLHDKISEDSIFILLLTFPIIGILIWLIVGKGLNILKDIAQEIGYRAPGHLKPVNLDKVPIEINSLVDALNKLLQKLHEAFEREKRFAGDAAHELRTPLAVLRTQTQVAINSASNEERYSALQKVLNSVDRSAHVVEQLLTLNRMMPDEIIDKPEKVDMNKQASTIISELAMEAVNKNIELELITSEKLLTIQGNPIAIGILMRNLIDNAIRYTPENGLVQVIIDEVDHKIVFRVIDNGPGIPDHLKQRVFERFFRIIGTRSKGSGLGLGIVSRIVQLHQAMIDLKTPNNGKGLEFIIIFPMELGTENEN